MNETAAGKSSQPTVALVLGILSILCCGLLGPIAWYMGAQELKAIAAGTSSREGEGLARAGKILGIVGTILLACCILWVLFWGGFAVLQGLAG
jgi:ABC-type Fe3+ transport system permease subunit